MKAAILLIFLFISSNIAWGQTTIDAFGSKIIFTGPNEKMWKLAQKIDPSESSKGVRMFKREQIIGTMGLPVEPVLALVFEKVTEPIDTIEYSVNVLSNKTYKLKWDLLGGYPDYSSDKHSVVYKFEYTVSGVLHKGYLCYILHKNVGVEIIADSTEDIFKNVESDMLAFFKSVAIQE
jgi:hypothetical protein